MGEQPNSSQTQSQYLETEMVGMRQEVDLEMSELDDEQCIYRVPQKIRQVNPKAHTPLVVSIGPFHYNDSTLKPMEEVKLKYLRRFLNRNKHLSISSLFARLIEKEKLIRSCYAGPIAYNSNDFLRMILVYACFIIEHFLRIYTGLDFTERDLLSELPVLNNVIQDLTLLENQLPFLVLEDIFNFVKPSRNVEFPCKDDKDKDFDGPVTDVGSLSFLDITFFYFLNYKRDIKSDQIDRPKHFTDLLRTFMQPSPIPRHKLNPSSRIKHLPSAASQLSEVGVVFKYLFYELLTGVDLAMMPLEKNL
ncbi:UPF0481 protein [Spatholobus suberectus]|nr:UPF0481 protein [Spatholobus suberectus]